MSRSRFFAAPVAAVCCLFGLAACHQSDDQAKVAAPAPAAPAKPAFLDVQGALAPVVLGTFDAGNPVAEATTGRLTIDDTTMRGDNGASFTTERVAISKGADLFASGGYSYASAMDIAPDQPVEIRKVLAQTPPTRTPDNAFCGKDPVAYIALVRDMKGGETVKLAALKGNYLPGPDSAQTGLCALTMYFPPLKP
jgi:hypothetical protein